tara:strand:- start:70 stop:642 length:573 start_codon:yes stop_codon:yes gene_type:complete
MFSIVLQVGIAWLYSHVLEYLLHRHVLHNPKVSKSWFTEHFAEHHFAAKRNHMIDIKYNEPITGLWKDQEIRGLAFLGALHFPIWFFFPIAYYTLLLCAVSYYMVHRSCHRDHETGRDIFPWHYDHHMAPNQHKNWGVRLPIIDWVFRTRKKWKGEKKEIVSHIIGKNGLKEYVKARSRRFERPKSEKGN